MGAAASHEGGADPNCTAALPDALKNLTLGISKIRPGERLIDLFMAKCNKPEAPCAMCVVFSHYPGDVRASWDAKLRATVEKNFADAGEGADKTAGLVKWFATAQRDMTTLQAIYGVELSGIVSVRPLGHRARP